MKRYPQQRLQPGQNLPVSSHHHIEMLPSGRVRSAAQPCWCHGPGAASKQTPKCPGSIRDLIFTTVSLLMLSLMGLTSCNIAQKVPVSGFPERTPGSQLRRQSAMPPALPAMGTDGCHLHARHEAVPCVCKKVEVPRVLQHCCLPLITQRCAETNKQRCCKCSCVELAK